MDVFTVTMPRPRSKFYEISSFEEIRRSVTTEMSKIEEALGYYPVNILSELQDDMSLYTIGYLFIGLMFNLIIALFIGISVLLIYSLLMITVETKTFEMGVMRMVGLNKTGLIVLVLT